MNPLRTSSHSNTNKFYVGYLKTCVFHSQPALHLCYSYRYIYTIVHIRPHNHYNILYITFYISAFVFAFLNFRLSDFQRFSFYFSFCRSFPQKVRNVLLLRSCTVVYIKIYAELHPWSIDQTFDHRYQLPLADYPCLEIHLGF